MSEALRSDGGRYRRDQVRRILRLSERQLAAWERQGFVQPARAPEAGAAASGGRPVLPKRSRSAQPRGSQDFYYSFSDIITLKTLLHLRSSGVPQSRLRQVHAALQQKLDVEKPWSELQIKGTGKHLTVQFQGSTLEPVTGQFLLDYAPPDDKETKTRVRPFQRARHLRRRSLAEKRIIAERFFMAGLRYEEAGGPVKKAIRAYQKAIEMNPEAAGAYINLGTIHYNLGQLDAAESCYQAALSIDSNYGLVHFNLGNVADEKNELPRAREHYEEAIRRDPDYPDPHYNLALVYEKLGLHGKARQRWLSYLKLDQHSQWAGYARQQLEKTPLRLIHNAAGSHATCPG